MFSRAFKIVRRATRWRMALVQRDYELRGDSGTFSYESKILNQAYAPWATDPDFCEVYRVARANTLVDVVRCYELWDLLHGLSNIPGAVIEVGVWRGGTGAILARALMRTKPNEKIYLCDTFSGVVKAGSRDKTYRGGEHADTSVEDVEHLLSKLSLSNAVLLKGMFPEETSSLIPPGPIALCHIDVDVYQSAKDTVNWVADRLAPGGALVFDDYGFPTCVGVTRYVHELKAKAGWLSIYNLNGHAILIKR
jgi:O-methyltransferase